MLTNIIAIGMCFGFAISISGGLYLLEKFRQQFQQFDEKLEKLKLELKPKNSKTTDCFGNRIVEPCPNVGQIFRLIINGSEKESQPITMVDSWDHYHAPKPVGWNYVGKEIRGEQIASFKLVQVGYCDKWEDLKGRLSAYGRTPEGQWIEVFRQTFPKRPGLIGVADDTWVDPDGNRHFPFIGFLPGKLSFGGTEGIISGTWVWLVFAG